VAFGLDHARYTRITYLEFRLAERGYEGVGYDRLPDELKALASRNEIEQALENHRKQVLADYGTVHAIPLLLRTSLISLRAAKSPNLVIAMVVLAELITSKELDLPAAGRALIETRDALDAYATRGDNT
jgi:hypothetical protein